MRAIIQRVSQASVTVQGQVVGQIGQGLLVLLGVGLGDGRAQVRTLVDKIVSLRIFGDDAGKLNRSLLETRGDVLLVSQFTLYADICHGRRPSFTQAAPPPVAIPLYEHCKEAFAAYGLTVASGIFGAAMSVELHNEGPVTLWLDTNEL